ncbi:hypothetical protein LXJ56_29680, partial [Escherichia coli]|nr:hypothetical protein [Escherichia coli]
MTDLLDLATRPAVVPAHVAANALLPLVAGDAPVTRRHLNPAKTAAYGGSDADGHWTQRDS